MWFWVLLIGIIILSIFLGLTLRDIWHSAKTLMRETRTLSEATPEFSTSQQTLSVIGNIYEDPGRIDAARADRKRIQAVRAESRRRRLEKATTRWVELNDDSFSSIGPEQRERALRQVKDVRE